MQLFEIMKIELLIILCFMCFCSPETHKVPTEKNITTLEECKTHEDFVYVIDFYTFF